MDRLPSKHRLLAAALATALLACRAPPGASVDAGGPPAPRGWLEEVREVALRMRDARFHAELLAELALVEAAREGPAAASSAERLLAEAVARAAQVPGAEDRARADQRIATAYATTGRTERALALARALRAPEARAEVLAEVGVLVARRGDHAGAAAIAEGIGAETPRGQVYVAAARAAAAAGAWTEARELVRKPPRPEQRAEAQAALAQAYAAAGRPRDALALIDGIDGAHWKGEAQAALVAWYQRQGEGAKAERLARAIESSWLQARSYAELAALAEDAGRAAEAERFYARSTDIADGIHDPTMRASAYEDLAVRGLARGRSEAARALARRCPSNDTRLRILARLAGRLAEDRRYEEAEQTARDLAGDPLALADAYAALVTAYGAQDDARALAALAYIPTLSLRLAPLARFVASKGAGPHALTEPLRARLAAALDAAPPPAR